MPSYLPSASECHSPCEQEPLDALVECLDYLPFTSEGEVVPLDKEIYVKPPNTDEEDDIIVIMPQTNSGFISGTNGR